MSRSLLLMILIIATGPMAMAQHGVKTFTKDGREWAVSYFTSGQRSTEVSCTVSDSRWKKLSVYDRAGHVIYETNYGQRYGSSHVDVKYYPDGAVYSTHYTMQPDGGIQYTDITTFFAPDGKVDHVEDNSLGNDGTPHVRAPLRPDQTPAPSIYTTPKSAECVPVPTPTEVYLINYTSERLHIRSEYKDMSAGPVYYDVEPADTVRIGAHYATMTADPLRHYSIYVETKPRFGLGYYVNYRGMANSNNQYVLVTCHRTSKK